MLRTESFVIVASVTLTSASPAVRNPPPPSPKLGLAADAAARPFWIVIPDMATVPARRSKTRSAAPPSTMVAVPAPVMFRFPAVTSRSPVAAASSFPPAIPSW